MIERLSYVGVLPHRVSPALREKLYLDDEAQRSVLKEFAARGAQRLLLCTCERVELYSLGEGETKAFSDPQENEFARLFELPDPLPEGVVTRARGLLAAAHLLRVAAGLDSRILGEPHILGQVRRAYMAASESGCAGSVLSALARGAVCTGKRVRSETSLGAYARSSATLAVDRVLGEFNPPGGPEVVIVGTGTIAEDVARAFAAQGCRRIWIAGRDAERARRLAAANDLRAAALTDLPRLIRRADAMVTCTSARTFLIDASVMDRAASDVRSALNRQLIVDLGVPRNVDPALALYSGLLVVDLEELVADLPARGMAVEPAERIIEEELTRFEKWLRARRLAPLLGRIADAQSRHERPLSRAERRAAHRRIEALKATVAA